MPKNTFLIISAVLLTISLSVCAKHERDQNVDHQLSFNRRSFLRFIDEDKLISYLSSFGGNPSAEESRRHLVYKRASGRIKKVKKNSSSTLDSNKKQPPTDDSRRSNEKDHVTKDFISPRDMVKFELEDAKYSEEYEKLRKSRKLRVKRSSPDRLKNETISKVRMEKFITKNTFIQPKEILKFVYSDAIIASSLKTALSDDKASNSEKKKREVGATDSTSSDSRKIKISHPLSSTSRTKHVSFEELPTKIQKIVESTISDAVSKGKASDGDYLKFYYGDKIFKVPVILTKYITPVKENSSKGLSDHHYTLKTLKFKKEDVVTELPKNPFSKYQSISKYETKPFISEKAESYANFVTPKENLITHVQEEPIKIPEPQAKKSLYFYSNTDDTLSSPVAFESSYKLPEKVIYDKKILYTSAPKEIVRESIPITEDFNESKFEVPLEIYPTSYMEYDDNLSKKPIDFHEDKNYAFGYHVSDFKSGNNFGHTQTKNNKEIKGEYSILLPDGRIQITKYFADDSGFHADVSYQNIH